MVINLTYKIIKVKSNFFIIKASGIKEKQLVYLLRLWKEGWFYSYTLKIVNYRLDKVL